MIQTLISTLQPLVKEILILSGWLAILSIIFIPLERLLPLHRQRIARGHFGIDLIFYYLAGIFPALIMSVPLGIAAYVSHWLMPTAVLTAVAEAPFWMRALAALLATEVGYYWGHRWTHEIPLLWRFHAVHHSARELDYLVSTHAHPVDTAFSHMCSMMPLYILGLSAPASESGNVIVVLVNVLGQCWGYFLHANLRLRLGPLEWLVSTPAFHHWHHTRGEMLDRNYAAILPWLDRLFGTWYLPKDRWPESYGIDQPMPDTLVGQLTEPFMPPRRPSPAT